MRADLTSGEVAEVDTPEGDIHDAFLIAAGTMVVSYTSPFKTIVRSNEGVREVPGVVVEVSPSGRLWLNAADPSRFHAGFTGEAPVELHLTLSTADMESLCEFTLSDPGGRQGSSHRLLIQGEFSHDDELLVTVEGTGVISLRDTRRCEPLLVLRDFQSVRYPMGAAFHPNSSSVVTGGRFLTPDAMIGSSIILWSR